MDLLNATTDMVNALDELNNAANQAKRRHRRSALDHSRGRRDRGNDTETINIIIEIRIRIRFWLVDLSRLTDANIPEIQATTVQIRQLTVRVIRTEVVITVEQKNILRSTTVLGLKVVGRLVIRIESEEKAALLQEKVSVTSESKTTITSISATMTGIANGGGVVEGGSAQATAAIEAVKSLMEQIVSGAVEFTANLAIQLSQLQATLESSADVVSASDMALVGDALVSIDSASIFAETSLENVEAAQEAETNILLVQGIITATSIIKDSINQIFNAMAMQSSTEIIDTFDISATQTQISLLQENIEAVTSNDIEDLKSFQQVADGIIIALGDGMVEVPGLLELQQASNALAVNAAAAVSKMKAMQAFKEQAGLLTNFENTLLDIKVKATALLDINEGSNVEGGVLVSTIIVFLQEFTIDGLTEESFEQFSGYAESMAPLVDDPTGAVEGVDDLLASVAAAENLVLSAKSEAELQAQENKEVELAKTIKEVVNTVNILRGKVNPESDIEPDGDLESMVEEMSGLMLSLSSGEEGSDDVETKQVNFSQKVSTIDEISFVAGLNNLDILAEIVYESKQAKAEQLAQKFENKQKLQNLKSANKLLEKIQAYAISTFVSGEEVVSIVVEQLQEEVDSWVNINLITTASIESVTGSFTNMKALQKDITIANIDDLYESIDIAQISIQEGIQLNELAIQDSEELQMLENAQDDISKTRASLLILQDITGDATEEDPAEEVNDMINIYEVVILDDMDENLLGIIKDGQVALKNFVNNYDVNTNKTVQDLQRAIDLGTQAEQFLDEQISQKSKGDDSLAIIVDIKDLAIDTMLNLELLKPGEVTEENLAINDVMLSFEQFVEKSLLETDKQALILSNTQIKELVAAKDTQISITGSALTIDEVITQGNLLLVHLDEAIQNEQEIEGVVAEISTASQVIFAIEGITLIGTKISEFETVENENSDSIIDNTAALNAFDILSGNVTDLKDIKEGLKTIAQGNKKTEGIENLLLAAENVKKNAASHKSNLESDLLTLEGKETSKKVLSTVENIETTLSASWDTLAPQQLIGEDQPELEELREGLDVIIIKLDSSTMMDIKEIEDSFVSAKEKLELLEDEESVNNLGDTISAAQIVKERIQIRLIELEDMKALKADKIALMERNYILVDIENVIVLKSEEIGEITQDDDEPESPTITNLKIAMENLIFPSFNKPTNSDLHSGQLDLENILIINGKDKAGLTELQSMTMQAIIATNDETQFFENLKEAREKKTILILVLSKFEIIQKDFTNLQSFFGAGNNDINKIPAAMDIFSLAQEMALTDDITFNTAKKLESLRSNLLDAYVMTDVDLIHLAEVSMQIDKVKLNILASLTEIEAISGLRRQLVIFEDTYGYLVQIKEKFEALTVLPASEDDEENEDILSYIALLQNSGENKDIDISMWQQLEGLKDTFEGLENISTLDEDNRDDAITLTDDTLDFVAEEYQSTQDSMAIIVKIGTLDDVIDFLTGIKNAVFSLKSDIGLASEEVVNGDINDLHLAVAELSSTSVNSHQIEDIKSQSEFLSDIDVVEGQTFTGIADLSAVIDQKLDEFMSSKVVLTGTQNGDLALFEEAEFTVSSLHMEFRDILDNFDLSGQESSPIVDEISDLLDPVSVEQITQDLNQKLKAKFNTLQAIKITITGGEEEIIVVANNLDDLENSITERKTALEAEQRRLDQTAKNMNARATVLEIFKLSEGILANGEETEDSEEDDDVSSIINILNEFVSNILGIGNEALKELKQLLSKLKALLAKKKVPKGITELQNLSLQVEGLVNLEIAMSEQDSNRLKNIELQKQAKVALSAFLSMLENILQLLGDNSEGEEIEISELTKSNSILQKIDDGTADKTDLENLGQFTLSLGDMDFDQVTNIIDLHSTIELGKAVIQSLQDNLINEQFFAQYSQEIFAQKEAVSRLSKSEAKLTGLIEGGEITDNAFVEAISSVNTEDLDAFSSETIKNLQTEALTEEQKVESLQSVSVTLQSASLTLSNSISQATEIYSLWIRKELTETIYDKLSNIYEIIVKIHIQVEASNFGIVLNSVDFDNLHKFLEGGESYETNDIGILSFYEGGLTLVLDAFNSLEIDEVDLLSELMTTVLEEKSFALTEVISARQALVTGMESVVSAATSKAIINSYFALDTAASVSLPGDLSELSEVTDLFFELQDIKAPITPGDLKVIQDGIPFVADELSSAVTPIAFSDDIVRVLGVIDSNSAKAVENKADLEDNRIIRDAFTNIEGTINDVFEGVLSLQSSIGFMPEEYIEDTNLTGMYKLFLKYSSDLRIIPPGFEGQLEALDITGITATEGTGYKHLSELQSLSSQYVSAIKLSTGSVAQADLIAKGNEFESSISHFMGALEPYAYGGVESFTESDEESEVHGIFGLVLNMDMDGFDFNSLDIAMAVEQINTFLGGNVDTVLTSIDPVDIIEYLNGLTSLRNSVSDSLKSKQLETAVKTTFSRIRETNDILKILKTSLPMLSGKLVSNETIVNLQEIENKLLKFSNVFLLSQADVSDFRVRVFKLRAVSIEDDTGNIDIGDISSLEEIVDSTANMFEESLLAQSSSITAMSASIGDTINESQGGTMEVGGPGGGSTGSPFGSSVYGLVDIPGSILQAAQQSYLETQLTNLLVTLKADLNTLKSSGGSGGPSSNPAVSRVRLIMEMATVNLNNLQYSILMDLASSTISIRSLSETEGVVVDAAFVDRTVESIDSFNENLMAAATFRSGFSSASVAIVTAQDTSEFMANLEDRLVPLAASIHTVTNESMVIEDSFLSEQANIFTSTLIDLSLMSASVVSMPEKIQALRTSSEALFNSNLASNPYYIPNFKVPMYFALESDFPISNLLKHFTIGSMVSKGKTQGKLYYTQRAQEILVDFGIAIQDMIEAGGTDELNPGNIRVIRFQRIISGAVNIFQLWSTGVVQQSQVKMCDDFLSQLPNFAALMKKYTPLPELNILSTAIQTAATSIETNLGIIINEAEEDDEDGVIDAIYMNFAQLNSFFLSITVHDENGINVSLPEVDNLISALETSSINPVDTDIDLLQATVVPFMAAILNVESNSNIINYLQLKMLVEDISKSLGANRQANVFFRISEAALGVTELIPVSGVAEGELYQPVLAVQSISMMASSMRTGFLSVSKDAMRTLSGEAPNLLLAVGEYGRSVAFLSNIEESLSFVSMMAEDFRYYTNQLYLIERLSPVLVELEDIIKSKTTLLRELLVDMGEVVIFETNEHVTVAYNVLVSFSFGLNHFPLDLNRQIESFDFSSVSLPETEGTGIQYLREVYDMMIYLEGYISRSAIQALYLNSLAQVAPAKYAMESVLSSLTGLITIPSESDGDGDDNDEGTDVPALVSGFQDLSGNLFSSGLNMSDDDISLFVSASENISMVSIEDGGQLSDLPTLITELREQSNFFHQVESSYGSAFLNSDRNRMFEDMYRTSVLIKSAIDMGVSSDAQSLVDTMVELCKVFVLGPFFVSESDLNSFRALAYNFSASADGSTGADTTELLGLLDQIERVPLATQGFLSAQQFLFLNIVNEDLSSEDLINKLELNAAYQEYHFLGVMDGLLTTLKESMTALIDAEGSGDQMNSTSFLNIRAALISASADFSSVNINSLVKIASSTLEIQGAAEFGMEVNAPEVESYRGFVQQVHKTVSFESSMIQLYGEATAKFLVAQEVFGFLTSVSKQIDIWFEGEEAALDGNIDIDSRLGYLINEGSDIFMRLTFDSESLNESMSVRMKRTLFELSSSFNVSQSTVPELRLWRYNSAGTLANFIRDDLVKAEEVVGIEQAAYTFSVAFAELDLLKETLETESNETNSNVTLEDEGDGTVNNTGNVTGLGLSIEKKKKMDQKKAKEIVTNRIFQIHQEIAAILNVTDSVKEVRLYRIKRIRALRKELTDLMRTKGITLDGNSTLKDTVIQHMNKSYEAYDAMKTYAQEVANKACLHRALSFLKKVKQFIPYSLGLFNSSMDNITTESPVNSTLVGSTYSTDNTTYSTANTTDSTDTTTYSTGNATGNTDTTTNSTDNTTDSTDTTTYSLANTTGNTTTTTYSTDNTTENTTTTTYSTDNTTDSIDNTTATTTEYSTMMEEDFCSNNESVQCASYKLLAALELAFESNNISLPLGEGNNSSACNSTFRFQDMMDSSFNFYRSLRRLDTEDPDSREIAKLLLKEACDILEDLIDRVTEEYAAMTNFTDVSEFYDVPKDSVFSG